jgi:hypothetical protein
MEGLSDQARKKSKMANFSKVYFKLLLTYVIPRKKIQVTPQEY